MSDYQIGQYRYAGSGTCLTGVDTSGIKKSYVTTSDGFKDVEITGASSSFGGFDSATDYYVTLKLPRLMNYDCTFTLKLIKANEDSSLSYQYIDTIEVPRGGTSSTAYRVALYTENGKQSGKIKAMVPLTYNANATSISNGSLYLKTSSSTSEDTYYVGVSGKYVETSYVNDTNLDATWISTPVEQYVTYRTTFRPLENNFTKLLLEMNRSTIDYNINNKGDDGTKWYGRTLKTSDITASIYKMTDLVSSASGILKTSGSLSKIGVWSHPGLMMAINGETIQIGSRGYYEFDALPITSIGVAAVDYNDNFTIDWVSEG